MASKTPLYILRGTVLYVTVGTDILCNYRQMYYIMLIYIYIYTHVLHSSSNLSNFCALVTSACSRPKVRRKRRQRQVAMR